MKGPPTRDELLTEYARLSRLMEKAGLEPTVSGNVVDVFDISTLRALVRDSVIRLINAKAWEA